MMNTVVNGKNYSLLGEKIFSPGRKNIVRNGEVSKDLHATYIFFCIFALHPLRCFAASSPHESIVQPHAFWTIPRHYYDEPEGGPVQDVVELERTVAGFELKLRLQVLRQPLCGGSHHVRVDRTEALAICAAWQVERERLARL